MCKMWVQLVFFLVANQNDKNVPDSELKSGEIIRKDKCMGKNCTPPGPYFSLFRKILNLRKMPVIKNYKAEKVSTETLAQKAIEVCQEMLTIMCERTSKDGEEDSSGRIVFLSVDSNTMYTNLRYFGSGQQLKISKVGDSLYSAIKDVMSYVMEETAKQSDCECRFQMPKHTSFIGQIVKVSVIFVFSISEYHS